MNDCLLCCGCLIILNAFAVFQPGLDHLSQFRVCATRLHSIVVMAGSNDANESHLSMREKSARKKKVNKLHENNYKAGSVPVDERQLHRTGIRGRKIYVLMFFLSLLLLLCLANLIILIIMYGTLDISYAGMKSLSFEKTGKLKWLLDSDLEYIFPYDGVIGGYLEKDLDFMGENQNVQFRIGFTQNRSSLTVGPEGTVIQMKDSYQFIDPVAKKRILKLSKDSSFSVTSMFTGPDLRTPNLKTRRIVSDDDSSLTITGKNIGITGNEGVFIDGKTVDFKADKNVEISVKDTGNGIKLNGDKGIKLVRNRLKDTTTSSLTVVSGDTKYRLCACVNNGRLFKVPLKAGTTVTCATATTDPCA